MEASKGVKSVAQCTHNLDIFFTHPPICSNSCKIKLLFIYFLNFWPYPGHVGCSQPGVKLTSLALDGGVFPTGPPGKSPDLCFFINNNLTMKASGIINAIRFVFSKINFGKGRLNFSFRFY